MKIKLTFFGVVALLSSCASDFHSAAIPPTPFTVKTREFAFSGQLGGSQKKTPQRNYASTSSSYSTPKTTRPKSTGGSGQMSANEKFALGFLNAMISGGGSPGGSDSASGYQNGEAGWAASKGR